MIVFSFTSLMHIAPTPYHPLSEWYSHEGDVSHSCIAGRAVVRSRSPCLSPIVNADGHRTSGTSVRTEPLQNQYNYLTVKKQSAESRLDLLRNRMEVGATSNAEVLKQRIEVQKSRFNVQRQTAKIA